MTFVQELKADPVRLSYRIVGARELLSGQCSLKTRYGTGTLNEIVVKDGDLLDENIKVVFRPYKDEILFRKTDRILVDRVLEVIQNTYDRLTSAGVCIKPLYSRPKGYRTSSGKGADEIFVYEIGDMMDHGKVSLPYYLYTRQSDGTTLGGAVPVLARRIRVHIYGNVYSEFKPGNVTVSEVFDLVKRRYDECKPAILNTRWGLLNTEDVNQPPRGRFRRTLAGIEYDLADLLESKAFLPVSIVGGMPRLGDKVIIRTTIDRTPLAAGTKLTDIWQKWSPKGPDTSCECGRQIGNLCIIDPNMMLSGKDKLPTVKGMVTSCKVIVEWSSRDVLCFDRNTPVEHILWTVLRLRKSNDPGRYKHRFVGPDMRRHLPEAIMDDTVGLSLPDIKVNTLVRFGPSLMPLYLHPGISAKEANTVYTASRTEADSVRTRNLSKAHLWINDATKGKNKT